MPVTVQSYLEDMLYDIKDHVGSTYSTYLDAMEVTKGSEIVMYDLKQIAVGDTSIFESNVSPVGFLFPTNIRIAWIDTGEDEIAMDLLVVIAFKGSGKDQLAIKALRYSECFRQMVNADKTLSSACDEAVVKQINYYGPTPGDVQNMDLEIIMAVILTVPHT